MKQRTPTFPAVGLLALGLFGIAVAAPAGQTHDPPDSFRGIKWDSPLPSKQVLRMTAMKGCSSIVEPGDANFPYPCKHEHLDADDQDLYTQYRNVEPIFNVNVSSQMLDWSYGKFWAGDVFIDDCKDSDIQTVLDELTTRYGEPTFKNDSLHITSWKWPTKHIEVSLSVNCHARGGSPSDGSVVIEFTRFD